MHFPTEDKKKSKTNHGDGGDIELIPRANTETAQGGGGELELTPITTKTNQDDDPKETDHSGKIRVASVATGTMLMRLSQPSNAHHMAGDDASRV